MAVRAFWLRLFKRMSVTSATSGKRGIGQQGEQRAEQYLRGQGLTPVTRNYNCGLGEIDLVMRDRETLVFVEVRRRKTTAFGSPLETVSANKQHKLQLAAQHYVMSQKIPSRQALRFDVVGIVSDGEHETIDWIRNAF